MYYQLTRLHFECTGCGGCCTGDEDQYVETSAKERAAIRDFLKLSPAWFRRRYLVQVDADTIGIRQEKDGQCTFLGNDNRCRIYPVRPRQCRTYPWWPEIIEHKRDWNAEAQRCEGINRGSAVPLSTIKRNLARERGE